MRWYESAGLEQEPELQQIRKMGVVGTDGVHLSGEYCRRTACYLCSRLTEQEVVQGVEGPPDKKGGGGRTLHGKPEINATMPRISRQSLDNFLSNIIRLLFIFFFVLRSSSFSVPLLFI